MSNKYVFCKLSRTHIHFSFLDPIKDKKKNEGIWNNKGLIYFFFMNMNNILKLKFKIKRNQTNDTQKLTKQIIIMLRLSCEPTLVV